MSLSSSPDPTMGLPPSTSSSSCNNSTGSSSTSNMVTTTNVTSNSASTTPTHNNNNNASISNNNNSSSNTNSNSGDGSQQFCLRWSNYQSNLTQVFEQLLETESFVDVTLSCEEKSIKAHRMVLSACSPYFQSILKEADTSHPVIILQGVKWYELKGLVDFMYKGEINVSQDRLAGLLRTAENLKVRGLTEVGDGEEAEAVITTSPSPRARLSSFSGGRDRDGGSGDDHAPRKRRRYSGDDLLQNNNNRSRSTSPPNLTSPMAMDFLDTTLEPIQAALNRSSASSQQSASSVGNGIPGAGAGGHSAHSPTASLASSLSTLAAHLPSAMPPPPGHPMGALPPHLAHLPPLSPLSPLLNMHHPMNRHHGTPDDFEIRPGIAEMIREEERRRRDLPDMVRRQAVMPAANHLTNTAKLLESSHHWIGSSMADTYQAQVQAAWQKSWNQTQSLLQNLRFRERGPLKSWRPETMAEAIHAVLKEGLSLSQAARKYDIPYPTFVLYANRVHNLLGPSAEPGDLRPKGRGRPQRILLGSWPEDQIKVVIRAVVFRDTSVFKDQEHKNRLVKENKAAAAAAKLQQQQIKEEAALQSANGSHGHAGSSPATFKPGTPTSGSTPDSNRSASTPGTSQGPSGIHGSSPHSRGSTPHSGQMQLHNLQSSHSGAKPPHHGSSPTSHEYSGVAMKQENNSSHDSEATMQQQQHSPHQSPAVSTPLPPPLSSPATPDTAVSLPPPSPSIVTPSPLGGTIPSTSDSPPACSMSPHHSPTSTSPSRRSPVSSLGLPASYKGMQHPQNSNGPCLNGTSMTQGALPFPQHLLQQQMLMQGALPPNMPPPPNHTRMPHMPPSPYPGYMRPPVPSHGGVNPRGIGHEESPEAMLFNKIVGGGQFPPMNPRPFFQQEPPISSASRNPPMMYHRDPSLDSIKSEPEPILN